MTTDAIETGRHKVVGDTNEFSLISACPLIGSDRSVRYILVQIALEADPVTSHFVVHHALKPFRPTES